MKNVATAVMAVFFLIGCGGGGGSSSGSSAVSNGPSEKLVANFLFQYNLAGQDYSARYTITGPTSNLSNDGTTIYQGVDANTPSHMVIAAWYPSLNKYLALGETFVSDLYQVFSFVIEGDNRLTGCYDLMSNGNLIGNCVSINSATSHRYTSGAWARMADSLARTPGGGDNSGMILNLQPQTGVSGEYATAVADLAAQFAPVRVE